MSERCPIRDVVIVGGGTAGWMTAAAAGRFLADGQRRFTLIESDAIGTIGVGEATIPPIVSFNAALGIDEAEFLRETQATYKLGIEFVGWGAPSERYIHPFGTFARGIGGVEFHQLWLKLGGRDGLGPITNYSMSSVAALAGRFAHPGSDPRSPAAHMAYAYHFDATLYAALLRRIAERRGVTRMEGRIVDVDRDAESGHVAALRLEDGRRVEGELFIDCSGFRSLLLGDAVGVPFDDWSHWLPCDRAAAMPSGPTQPLHPYTRATARPAGWQWRIPLQTRTGNGLVYSSAHMSNEDAAAMLLANLESEAQDAPRFLSFKAGRRVRAWEGNVVGLGLAAGFLEPLESTSIHLIQSGISKLLALFPDTSFSAVERDEYNRLMGAGYDAVRDFVILHFHATARDDSPFWRQVRDMSVPDSLAAKIALFREKGRIFRYDDDLFGIPNWVSVMLGQNIMPVGHDPVADAFDDGKLATMLAEVRRTYAAAAAQMPLHSDYVARVCAGGSPASPAPNVR